MGTKRPEKASAVGRRRDRLISRIDGTPATIENSRSNDGPPVILGVHLAGEKYRQVTSHLKADGRPMFWSSIDAR